MKAMAKGWSSAMVCKGNLFAHNYLKSTPQILFILTNQHIASSANELTSLLFQEAPQVSRCFCAARFSRGRAAAVEPGTGESHYRNGLWLLAGGKPRMSLQVTPLWPLVHWWPSKRFLLGKACQLQLEIPHDGVLNMPCHHHHQHHHHQLLLLLLCLSFLTCKIACRALGQAVSVACSTHSAALGKVAPWILGSSPCHAETKVLISLMGWCTRCCSGFQC